MTQESFNAGPPLAYFITWTTYGTWLPGDDRWWQRKGIGSQQPPNKLTLDSAREKMKESAFLMNPEQRTVVERTIKKHCQVRGWKLHAVNARSNHVHVVVTASGYRPELVRDQFKSWCTRRLKETVKHRERFWTARASCRWINHDEDLDSVVIYTLQAQD